MSGYFEKSMDTISLPKGYTAYVFGVARGDWKERVRVEVQNLDGEPESDCIFTGLKNPLVVTGGGLGFMNQQAAVVATDNGNERQIEIHFQTIKTGTTNPIDVKAFNKNVNIPFANSTTNYTYNIEDGGGGTDYRDNTFVISVMNENY